MGPSNGVGSDHTIVRTDLMILSQSIAATCFVSQVPVCLVTNSTPVIARTPSVTIPTAVTASDESQACAPVALSNLHVNEPNPCIISIISKIVYLKY